MDASSALSPWKARWVLLLKNVSDEESLEANVKDIIFNISLLSLTCGETERDDEKQQSASIIETPLIYSY